MVKRDPERDILQNPVPTDGVKEKTVDAGMAVLKAGNRLVSLLSGLLAAILILYSSYVLYDSISTNYQAYSSAWDLLKYKPEVMDGTPTEGEDVLASINKDYRAWLTVYDTSMDYPVVQGQNNLYYASHDVYGNASLTGAVYLAAENAEDFSDSYNLLYGHHMDNGAMFGALDKFMDIEYFQAHQKGVIVTKSGVYDIVFFAVVKTDAYENEIYTVGDRAKDVVSFITGPRDHDVGVGTKIVFCDYPVARKADKVIALSTCADAETNGRLVLFGKMIYRGTPTPTPLITEEPATPKPTKTPAPTATPEPTEDVRITLTVYYLAGDEEVFPAKTFRYVPGSDYRVVSPYYEGYTVDIKIVKGTIYEDTVVYVHYTPERYRLTVNYIYEDGSEAANPYKAVMRAGDAYNILSPDIEGYVPDRTSVLGRNPGRDETYTVIYIPEGTVTEEDNPQVHLDKTCIQVGICFE